MRKLLVLILLASLVSGTAVAQTGGQDGGTGSEFEAPDQGQSDDPITDDGNGGGKGPIEQAVATVKKVVDTVFGGIADFFGGVADVLSGMLEGDGAPENSSQST